MMDPHTVQLRFALGCHPPLDFVILNKAGESPDLEIRAVTSGAEPYLVKDKNVGFVFPRCDLFLCDEEIEVDRVIGLPRASEE